MNLLILGANSDLAYAVAKKFALEHKADLILASRDMELLSAKAADLEIRCGVKAHALPFDALDFPSHGAFYAGLDPKPDGVVLAFGHLGDQQQAQQSFAHARSIIDTNFSAAVSILEIIAADFERRGQGFIIGISSPAGERGRQSNYIYGAAKGGLRIYLGGLRNRLARRNVHVLTVLPGFVDTKMTADLDLPKLLTATPDQAARDIHRAYKAGRHQVYTRWFWRWIMALIKMIPESVFKRMSL